MKVDVRLFFHRTKLCRVCGHILKFAMYIGHTSSRLIDSRAPGMPRIVFHQKTDPMLADRESRCVEPCSYRDQPAGFLSSSILAEISFHRMQEHYSFGGT